MDPQRWAVIEALYTSALAMAPAERSSFLVNACGVDAGLRDQIESLLAYDDLKLSNGDLAELWNEIAELHVASEVAARPTHANAAPSRSAALHGMFGRYRIIRLIGEGGMGAVYEAEQDQPRRKVALKIIKPGLARPELLWRFAHEFQLLGRLQHPGIAQIYEAGSASTEYGRQPWFVMEFIDGESLLLYADAHQLTTRDRLELMVRICDAIHHAHQRGIIHRDLKPGNILVDNNGNPKVLDFGVARATDQDQHSHFGTVAGEIVGTLAYMSPEQLLADPFELDIRTDVYALGVILYELLSGRLPYAVSAKLHEAVRAVQEQEPTPLSRISRVYRGDIETIAGKALEKDKARRYASAADLGADIHRYLTDEPIMARPAGAAYQIRKFAQRHKAVVLGMLAVLMVLIAGILASSWEAMRALRAEKSALLERDRTKAAELRTAKERDRALSAEGDASRTLEALALALEQRVDTWGRVHQNAYEYQRQGKYEEAEALYRKCLEVAIRDEGRDSADMLQIMGDLAALESNEGKHREAEILYSHIAGVRRTTLGDDNPSTRSSMQSLAREYVLQQKHDKAELLAAAFNGRPEIQAGLREKIGFAYWELGQYSPAQEQLERALACYNDMLDTANLGRLRLKSRFVLIHDATNLQDNLANLYLMQHNHASLESLLIGGIEVRRRVLGDTAPETMSSIHWLADVYSEERKYDRAEPLLINLLDSRRRVMGENHSKTLRVMADLAVLYLSEGKNKESELLARRSLEGFARSTDAQSWTRFISQSVLGASLAAQKRYTEAESVLLPACEELRQQLPSVPFGDRTFITRAEKWLVQLYKDAGRPEKAAEWNARISDTFRY